MDAILAAIDDALKKKGLSDAAASIQAVGHPALIKKLRMPAKGEKRYNYVALAKLAEVLDLELYFGPPREICAAPTLDLDGQAFATIPCHDARAAAGDGFLNLEGPPVDHVAFSKDWLGAKGIAPDDAVIITAQGRSMEPTIFDGDMVMIDRRKTAIRSGRTYVFNQPDDGTRLKRVEVVPDTALILRSDNPAFAPEYHTGEAMNAISQNIVGEVVWSGHSWA